MHADVVNHARAFVLQHPALPAGIALPAAACSVAYAVSPSIWFICSMPVVLALTARVETLTDASDLEKLARHHLYHWLLQDVQNQLALSFLRASATRQTYHGHITDP
jgi:hypothetical protein